MSVSDFDVGYARPSIGHNPISSPYIFHRPPIIVSSLYARRWTTTLIRKSRGGVSLGTFSRNDRDSRLTRYHGNHDNMKSGAKQMHFCNPMMSNKERSGESYVPKSLLMSLVSDPPMPTSLC